MLPPSLLVACKKVKTGDGGNFGMEHIWFVWQGGAQRCHVAGIAVLHADGAAIGKPDTLHLLTSYRSKQIRELPDKSSHDAMFGQ